MVIYTCIRGKFHLGDEMRKNKIYSLWCLGDILEKLCLLNYANSVLECYHNILVYKIS